MLEFVLLPLSEDVSHTHSWPRVLCHWSPHSRNVLSAPVAEVRGGTTMLSDRLGLTTWSVHSAQRLRVYEVHRDQDQDVRLMELAGSEHSWASLN